MLKLLRQLKKSKIAILAVAILLIIQAACDLSLPTYTSDIVNVGIQQGGIDRIVPDVIRQTELDKLTLFMTEDDQELVYNNFQLLDQAFTNSEETSKYRSQYPLFETESLYLWNENSLDELTDIFAIPMMLVNGMNQDSELADLMRQQFTNHFPEEMQEGEMDPFELLNTLPEDVRHSMVAETKEQLSQIPESILYQSGFEYVKTEYIAVGIDVDQMQTNYILFVGAKMVGLALLAMVASVSVTFFAARIAGKLGKEIRSKVFRKVLSFSNSEMEKFSTASLITRSTNDIQQVQMMLVMLLRIVIYSPILALGGIIKVLNTNNSMTWILAVGVAAILSIILVLYRTVMPKFKIMQTLIDRINLVMREIITGLPVIRAFSAEDREKKRFDKANQDVTNNALFVNRVMTFMMPSMMLIMNLVAVLIVWVGAKSINQGVMQVGDMMAFIQYTMQIIMSFLMLTMISIMLPRASVSAKRINEIIESENTILDPENEDRFDSSKKGVVEFRNVSFRYPNADEDVLCDITFSAAPGQTTAIIGGTGSGKSTLINLIPRFYDVTNGAILVGGVDIRNINQHTLRERLGFIPQQGVLFSGTIESNIKFANNKLSDEAMERAARIAQAEEFIRSNMEGYQSSLSQGGTNVSGGQKQRLSIARAIANNPDIYIFDDSFSALDYKTDSVLRKTIKEEITEATVIIVAQRISTILNADQILVLDEGRIVGKGTHKELLKNCEVYQQIASSQLSKEELDHE